MQCIQRTVHNALRHLRQAAVFMSVLLLYTAPASAATLEKKTADAYDAYLVAVEQQIDREQVGDAFFWGNVAPQEEKLRSGDVLIQKAKVENQSGKVPDGLVHHW